MLDNGRLAWVNDLDRMKPMLEQRVERARQTARTAEQLKILAQLTTVYAAYDQERERAIALYHSGHVLEARESLLGDTSRLGDQASELCRRLVTENERVMQTSLVESQQRVEILAFGLGTGVALAILLSLGLVVIVFRRLLHPVRRLARDAKALSDPSTVDARFSDDVHALEFYSRTLMSDFARTRTDLEESQRRLLTAEKLAAIGKFAACAAHEIRSPLTSMRMWLHQLQDAGRSHPEVERSRLVLEEEIGRLDGLATSFLQLSSPGNGSLEKQDVSEIVDVTLELARYHLHERDIRIERDRGAMLPAVMANAHQLRQVLLNLITNAADATPRGGVVRIAESCEAEPNGRAEVVVRIQDHGPGIAEKIRDRLFEPFVTTKPNGTGLGLSVAASILAQHDGRLLLEASDASGTVFAMRLAACED
jgi:signal transduction histidine kinase